MSIGCAIPLTPLRRINVQFSQFPPPESTPARGPKMQKLCPNMIASAQKKDQNGFSVFNIILSPRKGKATEMW
jgi:hypothetical protein